MSAPGDERPVRRPAITGHWHGWSYVLGSVIDCSVCTPAPEEPQQ